MPEIEVCFSPLLFSAKRINKPYIIVVIDILRATTTMCTALEYGVKEIIAVSSLDKARDYKNLGFIVAGERDGSILSFADVGNSPLSFMNGDFKDKTLVLTTTNGTVAVNTAEDAAEVVMGAFSNLSVLTTWLIEKGREGFNVLMLCSGWYNQFSLEDSVFAGCLSEKLLESEIFLANNDAVVASLDLWKNAKPNIRTYMKKASHQDRLIALGVEKDIDFCFQIDTLKSLPILRDGVLVNLF